MNELLANPAIHAALISAAGTIAALAAIALSKLLHKLVAKTETKVDDEALEAVEKALKDEAKK